MKPTIFQFIFITLLFLNFKTTNAQPSNWLWANTGTGAQLEIGKVVMADDSGNVYSAGIFNSPWISFDTTTIHISGSYTNCYIVKHDASGNLLWARNYGASEGQMDVDRISRDANGYLYLCGSYTADSLTIGNTTLTNAWNASHQTNYFILKLNTSGNVVWLRGADYNGIAEINTVAAQPNGDFFVSGFYSSEQIIFGNDTLTNPDYANYSKYFLAKFDSSGTVLWTKTASCKSEGHTITLDVSQNLYVVGTFYDDSIAIIDSDTLAGVSNISMFVFKYDASGNRIFLKAFNDIGFQSVIKISVANDESFCLTGSFWYPTISFDSYVLTNTGIGFSSDLYIVKFDPAGNVAWAKSAGGTIDDTGKGITVDSFGNIYITGYFDSNTITFDTITLTSFSTSYSSIHFVKYDSMGNVIFAKAIGHSSGDADSYDLSADMNNNIFMTGRFNTSELTVGNIHLVNNTNEDDVFVFKWGSTTGIEQQVVSRINVDVFPNPSLGKFKLEIESREKFQDCSLKIYNQNASLVTELALPDMAGFKYEQYLELQLSKGIYTYCILSSKQMLTSGQFIIE